MNATAPSAQAARLHDLARRQMHSGDWDGARVSLQSLLHESPGNVRACMDLANILTRDGHWKDSVAALLPAVDHLPPDAPLVLDLVRELIARGQVVAARECLSFLARAPQPPAELLWSQAGMRYLLGEIAIANDFLERSFQAGADEPDCHYLHGLLLKFLGKLERAEKTLETCLQRWPAFGDAAVQLVEVRRQTPQANRLTLVDAQLGAMSTAQGEDHDRFNRAQFQYARFKILDDLDRCDEAWPALLECNRTMHSLHPYQPETAEMLADALLRMPLDGVESTVANGPDGAPTPIFIVGMPRSGTTLLDRMLSAHPDVVSAGEILDFERQLRVMTNVLPGYPGGLAKAATDSRGIDFSELGERYLQQTAWRAKGRGFFIDKLPGNIHMVPLIRRALPQAKILHMVRDPMDVCFSNFKAMFGSGSPYSYDMQAVAHYYAQYARVAKHWRENLPGAMLDVSYADLVDDSEACMRRVLDFCGLDMDAACLHPERNTAPVATPSSAQVREPIHRRGIGQWQRYAEGLQPLRAALENI